MRRRQRDSEPVAGYGSLIREAKDGNPGNGQVTCLVATQLEIPSPGPGGRRGEAESGHQLARLDRCAAGTQKEVRGKENDKTQSGNKVETGGKKENRPAQDRSGRLN